MSDTQTAQPGEFLLHETEDGRTRVECRFAEVSLWLTQARMAGLFQVKVPTINEHLKRLCSEGDIQAKATFRQFLVVRREGARQAARSIDHYNLDATLSVGGRVRSQRGTRFHRWATDRRMYPRERAMFAMAANYSPTLPEATRFFRSIRNELHFAVTGKAAAERIAERADSSLPSMGLTSWKSGNVQKADVTAAKNCLYEPERGR